jgi:HAD superfamily hydrolase (TIGR01509 family)
MKNVITVYPQARALIFDIDGTLADTMPAHFEVYKELLGKYGIVFTYNEFLTYAGIPVVPQMKLFKEKYQLADFEPVKMAEFKEDQYFLNIDKTQPIDQVKRVFDEFYGKLPIACGTGADKRIATRTLEVLGLIDKIDALVTSDDVTHGKPHPETFLRCAELLGVAPEHCQVFEDGDPGIEAAKAAGMMVTDVREYIGVE